MYIVVTGAAGLIGSNIVKALNARGHRQIIAVDNLTRGDKFRNLVDCDISDYIDKTEFLSKLASPAYAGKISAVFHQGACSDTMETDGKYMMENNFRYSLALLDYCQENKVPFLYASSASVYGTGKSSASVNPSTERMTGDSSEVMDAPVWTAARTPSRQASCWRAVW